MVETTTIYERHRELTPTKQCHRCRRVAYGMAKSIQISRVMSANMTHLTKILAVNRKQLSKQPHHRPPILWYLVRGGSVKQGRATVGKLSKSMH
jgi:hypothetical protein